MAFYTDLPPTGSAAFPVHASSGIVATAIPAAPVGADWHRRVASPHGKRARAGAPFGSLLRARALLLALLLAPLAAHSAELVVDIEEVSTQRGRLTVFVYDSAEGWENGKLAVPLQRVYPDGGTRLQARVTDLAPGRYGVVVLHDTNANGKFDRNAVGIPLDDYGFSNNPVVFGRPDFDRISFNVPAEGTRIVVRMR